MENLPLSTEIKESQNDFRKHILLPETYNFDGKLSDSYFETTNEAMIYLFGEPNKTIVGIDEVERYFGPQDDIEQEIDFIKLNYKIQMTEPSHLKFELVTYTTGNEIDPDNEQQWIILVEDLNHQEAIMDYLSMLFYFYVDDVPFRFYSISSKEDK